MKRGLAYLIPIFIFTFSNPIMALTTIGTLQPHALCNIASAETGRIEKVLVDVGDKVTKEQPLIQLEPQLLEIETAQKKALLEIALLEFQEAEIHFTRMKRLWEKPEGETPSIPQKRFEDAFRQMQRTKFQLALAEENLKRAQVKLKDAVIRAPFDGTVTKRLVETGDSVTSIPITHLLEIQSVHPLYLEFSISQTLLNSIKPGSPIMFNVEGSGTESYPALIEMVYPAIDEGTRSVKCRAIIDNQDGQFRPGSLAKVEIAS